MDKQEIPESQPQFQPQPPPDPQDELHSQLAEIEAQDAQPDQVVTDAPATNESTPQLQRSENDTNVKQAQDSSISSEQQSAPEAPEQPVQSQISNQDLPLSLNQALAREEEKEKQQQQAANQPAKKTGSSASNGSRPSKRHLIIMISIGLLSILLLSAWFIAESRHAFLNLIGARSSVIVVSTQEAPEGSDDRPELKNFTVSIDGQEFKSGDKNQLSIFGQEYGPRTIKVSKKGYSSVEQQVTIDFDPLFGLTGKDVSSRIEAIMAAQGVAVNFIAKDWTSGLPLTEGSFTLGDVTAKPNKDGQISLVVPPTFETIATVEASFEKDYLGKKFEVSVNDSAQEVLFVPANKHYFVSKRSGVYSIYSSYLDGSDLKELVKGTNQETASMQFAVSPSGKYGVMTSSRDGRRDNDGNLMQRLYWVNLKSGKLVDLDSAQYFHLHDWSGDTITYSYSYLTEENKEHRQRLRSLDTMTQNQYELGSTTGFINQVHVSHGMAVYVKQESWGKPGAEKEQTIHMVGIRGENSKELATNTNELRQLDFSRFAYQAADNKWNELTINTGQIKSIDPPGESGAVYISTESSNKERIFIKFIDGKRILTLRQEDGKTKELVSQAGITGPIKFINSSTIVYRIASSAETADYSISILGGEPRKITDVTASAYASPVFFNYY